MKPLFVALKSASALRAILPVAVALLFSGCTKELPEFEANNFDGITLTNSGIATKTLTLAGASNSALISGTCADTVEVVWIQDPNDTYWLKASDVALSGADLDCSDGTYSFSVDTSAGTFFYDRSAAFTKAVGIRGTTKLLAVTEYYFNFVYYGQSPPSLKFTTSSFSVLEGPGSFSVFAELSFPASVDVTFTVGLGGSATYGSDYTISPNTLITITAGQTSSLITFTAPLDLTSEADETVAMSLSNINNAFPAATDQSIVATIHDNDVGTFNISGITAPTDTDLDSNLNGSAIPEINWTAAASADSYVVEIYDLSSTLLCSSPTLISVVKYQFTAPCALTISTHYIAKVIAFRNSAAVRFANLSFFYNNPPVFQNTNYYSNTAGTLFTIPLAGAGGFATDPDNGALYVVSVTADTSGTATVTNQSTSIDYTPSSTFYGVSTFDLVVRDDNGGSASQTITVRHVGPHSWTGNGGNSAWSTPMNWCGSLNPAHTACLGGTVPTGTSYVYIDSTCNAAAPANCNPVSNAGATANGIKLKGRTLTQVTVSTLTIGPGGFTIDNNATFIGGTGNITVQGPFNFNSGTFTSTSGTLSLRRDATFNPSTTFIHNNGTVDINGMTSGYEEQIILGQPTVFWGLKFGKTLSSPSHFSGTARVDGTLQIYSSLSQTSNANISAKGNINFASGTARDLAGTTVSIDGTGSQTLTVSSPNAAFRNLIINKVSGLLTVDSDQDYVFVKGNIDISAVAGGINYIRDTGFKLQGGEVDSIITVTDPSFVFDGLLIAKSGVKKTFFNGDVKANFVRFNNASISNQLISTAGGKLVIHEDLMSLGPDVYGDVTIRMASNAAQGISTAAGTRLPDIEIDNLAGVTFHSNVTADNITLMPNATAYATATHTVNIVNNLTLNSGSNFYQNPGTVTYGNLVNNGGTLHPP